MATVPLLLIRQHPQPLSIPGLHGKLLIIDIHKLSLTFNRYADVEHAVKPVTEGYRLVLTYNIIHTTNTPTPSAMLLFEEKLRLERVLDTWDESMKSGPGGCKAEGPAQLAYVLDHKYKNGNLNLAHLKGKDCTKVMFAKEICESRGFKLLLANSERRVYCVVEEHEDLYGREVELYGDELHEMTEVLEEKVELELLVDLGGKEVAKNVEFKMSEIIQPAAFSEEPDGKVNHPICR